MLWQLAALAFLASKYEASKKAPVYTIAPVPTPQVIEHNIFTPPPDTTTHTPTLPNPDIGTFQTDLFRPIIIREPPPENSPAPWQITSQGPIIYSPLMDPRDGFSIIPGSSPAPASAPAPSGGTPTPTTTQPSYSGGTSTSSTSTSGGGIPGTIRGQDLVS